MEAFTRALHLFFSIAQRGADLRRDCAGNGGKYKSGRQEFTQIKYFKIRN
jgi:hypothetical protein